MIAKGAGFILGQLFQLDRLPFGEAVKLDLLLRETILIFPPPTGVLSAERLFDDRATEIRPPLHVLRDQLDPALFGYLFVLRFKGALLVVALLKVAGFQCDALFGELGANVLALGVGLLGRLIMVPVGLDFGNGFEVLCGLVTVLRRSPISLCHLGLECERADAAQI